MRMPLLSSSSSVKYYLINACDLNRVQYKSQASMKSTLYSIFSPPSPLKGLEKV